MPALTAREIALGKGGKPVPLPRPPDPGQPGHWRCCLCPNPRWRRGTLADAADHYQLFHQTTQGEAT